MPTPSRFNVLVADFLDETLVEAPILDDVATLELGRAMNEAELASRLPRADAVILFHDIPRFGEASFELATRCRCLVRAGVGFNNVDLDAATRQKIMHGNAEKLLNMRIS